MEYYTRNEIAEELGITPQAIGKRLKATGLIAKCKKSGKRLLIPEEVMGELRKHYDITYECETTETNETETSQETETTETNETQKETKPETLETNETETSQETETTETILLMAYEELKRQLAIKDEQIKALNEALLNAQEQGKAAQLLHGAEKKQALLVSSEEAQTEEPKSRWQRLREAWRG